MLKSEIPMPVSTRALHRGRVYHHHHHKPHGGATMNRSHRGVSSDRAVGRVKGSVMRDKLYCVSAWVSGHWSKAINQ